MRRAPVLPALLLGGAALGDDRAVQIMDGSGVEAVSDNAKLVTYKGELRRLLELADFIKFAKGASMPGENEEAFSIVREFVQNTRPTPEEEALARETAKANGEKSAASGKQTRRMADRRKKPHKSGKEGQR